ncbi:pVI [Bottlenose dolphin adenovirus 1]|uniref:PVI n=1 Tax=Bottlenose dolphin adenovirus 1 TaxID=1714377 RepID=A0A1X7MPS6_9ADEN|nr:pVI [Bottlenose dolphin adenovirus 1]SMG83448.1 pVI [Bottlenose dolphin adenovirus 1]
MEDINFSALAPRFGSRPMVGSWTDIGVSTMNGGAINWGNMWSAIKNFGSNFGSKIKNWGTKAWNSNTANALKKKLKDTDLQEKVVSGISTGIHGAVDLANQLVQKEINARLEKENVVEPEEEKEEPEKVPPTAPPLSPLKRPRDEREPPPSYDSLFPEATTLELKPTDVVEAPINKKPRPPPVPRPFPSAPIVPESRLPISTSTNSSNRGWQGALNNLVGVGMPCRCRSTKGAGVKFLRQKKQY